MKPACRIGLTIILIAVITITGCSITGGMTQSPPSTLGQELIDLQKAYEKGAVSDSEYKEMKEKLMESAGTRHRSE